ncbi:Tyrosine recombinase XerC [Curvibacter sp. AEP1-3]|uniref:tyrosine-type recombinase/integrase n=1 Tax=Curvibacter sp. AEP1-3 TaxID=1844971 RepID=UPI000B3D079A|nr:site-specific integrase [Curvibacter sp. AEP1-3]ARV17052.1 Tyrosine recombinase XerC [Curvibacter sp. AEP1-3]
MAAFSQLPSGKWRAQVRRAGLYRNATFNTKREAKDWAAGVESQAKHISASGLIPIPQGSTVSDLIDRYTESIKIPYGKTKAATLNMLKREIGTAKLVNLNSVLLRDFIDRREKDGAGGVTIAGDLSHLSQVLKWARHARQLDISERLALEARASLVHRGLKTRSNERDREPSDEELSRLYSYWDSNPRQKIPMPTLCKFAIATGMRQGEICRLEIEDINFEEKTIVIRDRKDPRIKQGNHQTVPLLPAAWAILEPLIEEKVSGYLFPYDESSVSTAFTRACKKVAPPIFDLHFHDLRHRATASFFRMGLDIPRVALMTGHKTWTMLRRYTSIKAADVHETVSKLSANRGSDIIPPPGVRELNSRSNSKPKP